MLCRISLALSYSIKIAPYFLLRQKQKSSTPSTRGVGTCRSSCWRTSREPRLRTGFQPHPFYQAVSSFSSHGKANQREQIAQTCGASSRGSHHSGQAFGKDPALTFRVSAEKASYMQFEPHRPTRPG